MSQNILINCDMGECLNPDPDPIIMPLIDMANIACGGHAGDDNSMVKTIQLAKKFNVSVGAHPSYDDSENFGRVSQKVTIDELKKSIFHQIEVFTDHCFDNELKFNYIKPHGALYHDMMIKKDIMDALVSIVMKINPKISLIVPAGHEEYISDYTNEINFYREVFADRLYMGVNLVKRSKKGSVFDSPEKIVNQYKFFKCLNDYPIDTICFHGDNFASVQALQELSKC